MNDNGSEWLSAWVQTDFGPHVQLHDYSGANRDDRQTDDNGWFEVGVPPMGYVVWGPAGITDGFAPAARRTMQEFQLDDDLGDSRSPSLGYGGKVKAGEFRTAGAVWIAANSSVKVDVYCNGPHDLEVRAFKPMASGAKSSTEGHHAQSALASNGSPVTLTFTSDREGYHQLAVQITNSAQQPTRAYVKVDYQAPATSVKF